VVDHFEKFCCVLKSYPCYNSLAESLITSFVALSSKTDIKEYIKIDAVLLYLDDLFTELKRQHSIQAMKTGMAKEMG